MFLPVVYLTIWGKLLFFELMYFMTPSPTVASIMVINIGNLQLMRIYHLLWFYFVLFTRGPSFSLLCRDFENTMLFFFFIVYCSRKSLSWQGGFSVLLECVQNLKLLTVVEAMKQRGVRKSMLI